MAAKAAMANATPNYFSAEAMGFILAALFFNTLTAPVVKMTQNAEGGYDYNKWRVSRRPAVLRCLHAIDATRRQETMSWLRAGASTSSLN